MNNINLSLSDNTTVTDLMADVDLTIKANKPGEEADFCDVIRDVILARCEGKAKLQPGAYNIRMLCVVTRNEEQHVEQAGESSGNVADHNLSGSSEADRG